MLTSREKEFITPKLVKVLHQLIESDFSEGVELDMVIQYMEDINRVDYSKEKAMPYLNELCERKVLKEVNGKYYPI